MTYRGNTDRRYQDWHYTLPGDWDFIDLDGLDCCHRCRCPLLLTETSRDPDKATSIMCGLAKLAGVPAVLIIVPECDPVLTDDSIIRWRFVNPARGWQEGSLAKWRADLDTLRAAHTCDAPALRRRDHD